MRDDRPLFRSPCRASFVRAALSPIALAAALAIALTACSGDDSGDGPALPPLDDAGVLVVEGGVQNVVTTHPDLPPIAGQSTCTIVTGDTPLAGAAPHVPECTPIEYPTEPPTNGPHYPIWAAWRRYRGVVPEPYLVHNLEHGGIVFFYNCPNGCPDVLAAFDAVIDSFPRDPTCSDAVKARFVVAEDPKLDVPLAAASFYELYRATCIDRAGLAAFAAANYNKTYEDLCADGFDFTAPDGGTITTCAGADAGAKDAQTMEAAGGG